MNTSDVTQLRKGRRHSVRRWSRGGIAVMWLVVAIPCLIIMLCTVVEVGHLWLARVELVDALEAAALAGVQEWEAGGGSTLTARNVAVEYARANSVAGNSVTIATNRDPGDLPNENADCNGDLVFGALTGTSPNVFDAGIAPGASEYAVRARARVPVQSVCGSFLGYSFGPFTVAGEATAYFNNTAQRAKLIRIQQFICL